VRGRLYGALEGCQQVCVEGFGQGHFTEAHRTQFHNGLPLRPAVGPSPKSRPAVLTDHAIQRLA